MPGTHTILVVDDEPSIVRSMISLLHRDYTVFGAGSAKDGFEIMRREEVHVVITDQRMPEMTGVEFLKQLAGEYPASIRILLTGYSDITAVIEAFNAAGAYQYIAKPWETDAMLKIIKMACDHYDTHRLLTKIRDQVSSNREGIQNIAAEVRKLA